MLKEEIQNIKSTNKELKDFAHVIGAALIVVGLLLWYKKDVSFVAFALPATVLVLIGWIRPILLKPLQRTWMTLALCLGWVVGNLLLTLVFLFMVTPIGIILKFMGKDFMNRKYDQKASTYWQERSSERDEKVACEQQF